jgi:hypothetical protein
LFDALRGPHFTAIAYGSGAAEDLERLKWPAVGAGLKRLTVASNGSGTFQDAYGLTGDTLLLIRPDGYLGHIATKDFRAGTEQAVQAVTPA